MSDTQSTQLLIADDDRIIVATLAEELILHGYHVHTASDGGEVVSACANTAIDLAILDIRMPVINGIDAAQIIREQHEVPSLFLSAYSDFELVERAVAEGALGYLVKPVNSEKLIPAIVAALARARDIRALADSRRHLERALNTKRETDIAVGILIERLNLDRTSAFEVLRRTARSANRKLNDVASELIERGEWFADAVKAAQQLPTPSRTTR